MKKSLMSLGILTALLAFTPFQNPKTVKIELTIPQTEVVVKALQKLPYEESAAVINIIVEQANKQLSDTTKRPAPVTPKKN